MKVYLNGELKNEYSISNPGFTFSSDEKFYFGRGWDNNKDRFRGKIDEVMVFNRTLTSEEVSKLYNISDFGSSITKETGEKFDVKNINIEGNSFPSNYYQYKINLHTMDSSSLPTIERLWLANVSEWSEWSGSNESNITLSDNRYAQIQFNFTSDSITNSAKLDDAELKSVRGNLSKFYEKGYLVSSNLLSDESVNFVESVKFNISSVPTNTSLKVKFSKNQSKWINSTGGVSYEILNEGYNYFNLSGLDWSENSFYYKMNYSSNVNGNMTPKLNNINLSIYKEDKQ